VDFCKQFLRSENVDHTSQHVEAIKPTVRVTNQVSATIFDDKVRDMGTVTVDGGKITVVLHSTPSMVTNEATRDFLVESIGLGIRACYDANPDSFDPYRNG
jgi:hypothetical protein